MAGQKQVQKSEEKVASKVSEPRQKAVRAQLILVSKDIETGYLTMAQLLNEAFHKEYHKEWGYDSFSDYAEKELEVEYRKARYLLDIWETIKGLDLPKEKLVEIAKLGWTKVKDLAAVITKKNAEKLLKQAKSMSSRELTESVKVMRKTGGSNLPKTPSTLKITFTLGESEHNIVMQALEEAKKLSNSDNAAVGLEMICQDWMTDKGAKPEITHLEDHIKYLEKIYPVEISFKEVKRKKAIPKVEEPALKKGAKGKGKKAKLPDPDELPEAEEETSVDDLLNT